ncbi:MAG TPA: hypothetical protein VNK05_17560 [Chloroflexota bacterium]|nr:hypothetical protein [Chloroflexota bacterium]
MGSDGEARDGRDGDAPPPAGARAGNEAQRLQLELIRLHRFNRFDGRRVAGDLEAHRGLWEAAWMRRADLLHILQLNLMEQLATGELDREHVLDEVLRRPESWTLALTMTDDLIPLRDLPEGHWNVDRLYVLARPDREAALEALARTWLADEVVWLDGRVAQVALGGHWRREPQVLVVWWD